MKAGTVYIFILMFVLIIVTYYVGTSSILLEAAKVSQQLAYFFTARDQNGQFVRATTPSFGSTLYQPLGKGAGNTDVATLAAMYPLNPIETALVEMNTGLDTARTQVIMAAGPAYHSIAPAVSGIDQVLRTLAHDLRKMLGIGEW